MNIVSASAASVGARPFEIQSRVDVGRAELRSLWKVACPHSEQPTLPVSILIMYRALSTYLGFPNF